MDKRLQTSAFIGGKAYSVADIAIFPWLRSWQNQGIDWANYPALKLWFDKIAARPAVQRGCTVLADLRKPLTDAKARDTLFGQSQYQKR
jgi:GST-like protein